jgi:Uncharacterised nucleotidyltransferase
VARRVNRPAAAAVVVVRACLATADDPRPDAWRAVRDAPELLRLDPIRRAGLLPQLLQAATLAAASLPPQLRSRFRAAHVHEELRTKAAVAACQDALVAEEVIVLRGVALAHTVYDAPPLRHCHDLDLLGAGADGTTEHPSGFPISRHRSLFAHRSVGIEAVLADAVNTEIAGVPARVLHPADALVHGCVHALTLGIPDSPLWALDCALVVRRTEALDWTRVISRASEWSSAHTVARALGWLRRDLGVPVPASVVRRLRAHSLRALPSQSWARAAR